MEIVFTFPWCGRQVQVVSEETGLTPDLVQLRATAPAMLYVKCDDRILAETHLRTGLGKVFDVKSVEFGEGHEDPLEQKVIVRVGQRRGKPEPGQGSG